MSSFANRLGRGIVRLLFTLVALALVGLVLVLLSQLNAQSFFLEAHDKMLVVMRGRLLPVGKTAYQPQDSVLADTYAPIPLETEPSPDLLATRFRDRESLDRALFNILAGEAATRVVSEDPQRLDRGVYYLRRAEHLTGLSGDQRQTLKRLQTDMAFYLSRQKLDEARRMLNEGLAQLRSAASDQNRHARAASQMLLEVEPPAKALEVSLARAVHQLSEPAPVPPSTTPAASIPIDDAGTSL